jgi:U3 small nucleolar RNA-associated protein 11
MTSTTKTNAMKNYIPRRTYRERGQLTHRKNLGILEKKKDYLKRSRDFKNKDATIKKLSMKA